MSTYDIYLTNKYKQVIGLNNIQSSNSGLTLIGGSTVISNVNVSNKSLFNKDIIGYKSLNVSGNVNLNINLTALSLFNNNLVSNNINLNNLNINNIINNKNINISNNSVLNNGSILSSLYVNDTVYIQDKLYLNNINLSSISANNINIGGPYSLTKINGTLLSILTNDLQVVDKYITLNCNGSLLTPLDTGSNSGIEIYSTSGNGYLRTDITATRFEHYLNNNLNYIVITDSSNNLSITGKSLLYGNTSLNSSLYIDNNSSCNNAYINNNLFISTISNFQNITLNSSLNISTFSIFNNVSINTNLYVSGNTNINNSLSCLSNLTCNNYNCNNVSILSNLLVNNITTISNKSTLLSNMNCLSNSLFNNLSVSSNLYISGNANISNMIFNNLYVSGYTNINNNITILSSLNCQNNTIINGNITLGSLLNNITINSWIIMPLKNYDDNLSAVSGGIINYGLYRTGDIVKIKLPDIRSFILDNGYLSITNNYNIINNNNWTIEAWFYPKVNSNSSNDAIVLFDFRTYPYVRNRGFTCMILPNNKIGFWNDYDYNLYGQSTSTITYNTWNHIVFMRSNNSLYAFINGVSNLIGTNPAWINNLTSLYSLYIGVDNYWITQNGITTTRNRYFGEICQPVITLGAKYNVNGFTPQWDISSDNRYTKLFCLESNFDIISKQSITYNNTISSYSLNTSPILPVINIPGKLYTLNDLIGKTAGTYPIKCTDGNIRNYYWDGTYLVIYKEQLDANSYTSNWSNTTTQYMSNFGDMGAGYAHGYTPNSTYTLNINILVSGYNKAVYSVKLHYVDSWDYESAYVYINNFDNAGRKLIWQGNKNGYPPGQIPTVINYENTTSTWNPANYSYSPFSNNTSTNGYSTITTKEFNFTSNSISIEHNTNLNEGLNNEAFYMSHSVLYLKPDDTNNSIGVPLNSIYTDPGVSVSYILNPYLIAYIVSIKDNSNNELLSSQLNALNNNILSFIDTTILNKTYTITYKVTDEYGRNVLAIKNITIVLAYNIYDLLGKIPGTYPIICTDTQIRNYYWDGTYLVIYKEQLDANSYTSNWSPTTTQYMSDFGGLGAGYAHGYNPLTTYTLTINIPISGYYKAKYEVKIHYVDSWDGENNYIYINNFDNRGRILVWQSSKVYTNSPSITNYENNITQWSGYVNYSYRPLGMQNQSYSVTNGYNTITTKEFNLTSSSISIEHQTRLDQDITDEAFYISHSVLYLKPENPILILNGNNNIFISLNYTYTDLGITVLYSLNYTAQIISIKDNNNNELLSTPLNALTTNVLNVLNTSSNNYYTITYNATTTNGYTTPSIYRTVYVGNMLSTSYNFNYGWLGKEIYNFTPYINNTDFTIEAWVYLTSYGTFSSNSGHMGLVDFRDPSSSGWDALSGTSGWLGVRQNNDGNNGKCVFGISLQGLYIWCNSATNSYITNNTVALNTWTHVVWMRKNNYLYGFINGYNDNGGIAVQTNLNNLTNLQTIIIGRDATQTSVLGNWRFQGYASQVLIRTGGQYNTSGFIPYNDLTSLSQSNSIFFLNDNYVDKINNYTLPIRFSVPTTNRYYNYIQAYDCTLGFIGSINPPSNSNWNTIFSNDFTFETWLYPTQYNSQVFSIILDTRVPNGYNPPWLNTFSFVMLQNGTIGFYWWYVENQYTAYSISSDPILLNQWSHVVWMRKNNILYVYINGNYYSGFNLTSNGIVFNNLKVISFCHAVDRSTSDYLYSFQGLISQPLMTNYAKYNTSVSFVPAIDLTPTNYDSSILFFVGNNLSNYGTTQSVTSTLSRTGSIYNTMRSTLGKWITTYNGSNTLLYNNSTDLSTFVSATSWTFESYIYLTSITNNNYPVIGSNGNMSNYNRTGTIAFGYNNSQIWVYNGTTDNIYSSNNGLKINSWNHIAYVMNNSVITFYINGINLGSTTSISFSNNNIWQINGTPFQINNTNRYINGYYAQVALMTFAKYTNDFIPYPDLTPSSYINYIIFLGPNANNLVTNTSFSVYNNYNYKTTPMIIPN
jgi:hypothetical protein